MLGFSETSISTVILANGCEDVQHPRRFNGPARVGRVAGNQCAAAWPEKLAFVSGGKLDLAGEHVRDLFVRMLVNRDDGTSRELNFTERDGFAMCVSTRDPREKGTNRTGGEMFEGHSCRGSGFGVADDAIVRVSYFASGRVIRIVVPLALVSRSTMSP